MPKPGGKPFPCLRATCGRQGAASGARRCIYKENGSFQPPLLPFSIFDETRHPMVSNPTAMTEKKD